MLESLGPRTTPDPSAPARRAFFDPNTFRWDDPRLRREATYIPPGGSADGSRSDAAPCPDREADGTEVMRRTHDEIRRRAFAGDDRFLVLLGRMALGMMRPGGQSSARAREALPAEVASAMIEAGLAALGVPTDRDVPPPAPKSGSGRGPRRG